MSRAATVMVIDDDEDLRESVSELLEDAGHVAVRVPSARAALDRLRSEPRKPDVILLDLMMPGMSGWQFRQLQLSDPALSSIPVVVMTASRELHEISADEVVYKPVKLDALLSAVRRHAGARASDSARPSRPSAPARVPQPREQERTGEPFAHDTGVRSMPARAVAQAPAPADGEARARRISEQIERRFDSLVDQIQAGIARMDLDGRFTLVNERFREIVGRSFAELEQLRLQDIVHPDDAARHDEQLRRVVEQAMPAMFEGRYVKPDGSIVWVQTNVSRIDDADDGSRGMAAVTLDITQRKYAEQALRDSEARFRNLANHAPVMVWMAEPDGRCTFRSESWCAFTGQSAEAGLGSGWLTSVHPDERSAVEHTFRTAIAERAAFRFEYRLRRKDGVYRWVIDSATPRLGSDGALLGYIGSVADMTEQVESRQRVAKLQRATEQLAAALTLPEVAQTFVAITEEIDGATAAVVYLRDEDGEVRLAASRGIAEAVLEGVRSLPLGEPWPLHTALRERRAVWLPDYDALVRAYPAVAGTQTPRSSLQAVAALPLLHRGDVIGGVAFSFDAPRSFDQPQREWFTSLAVQCATAVERVRLYRREQAARAEAETLFRVAEALQSSQHDLDALVQRVTDEATAMVGASFGAFFYNVVERDGEAFLLYTLSGAPKEAFAELGLPRNTPLFEPTFRGERILRLDDVKRDPRYGKMAPHYGMPPGHLPVTSYLAVPVFARSGAVLGGLFFGHPEPGRFTADHERMIKAVAASAAIAIENAQLLRASRTAEEAQARLLQELQQALKFSDMFVGILGHDLRNPLTAIMTAADLLLRRANSERITRPIERIRTSAARMGRMIDQILDFTRARIGGGIPIVPAPVDLQRLVAQLKEEIEAAAPQPIVLQCSGDTHGEWDGDRLAQVISNLLGNAVEHGDPQQPIRLLLDGRAADRVELSICNGGVIPEAQVSSLFDPFRRASAAAPARSSRGLGLGLYVVQQLVHAHGGTIAVESSAADGTRFTISLPRRAPQRDAAAARG